MHISLTDALEKMIKDKVASGMYSNASEVVREALRMMAKSEESQQQKLLELRELLQEGASQADAGNFSPYSMEEMLQEIKQDYER